MAIGTSNYPASLDTADELVRAVNDARTTVGAGGATNSATTINVTSASAAPSSGIAVLVSATDDTVREIVSYTGKTGTSITGCVRNLEGSGAKAWAAGDFVYFDTLTALSRSVLVDAVLALESKVGAGSVLRIVQDSSRTGSNSSTAQAIFNESTNGAANVEANTTYRLRLVYRISTSGTTSHNLTTLFAGTATVDAIGYKHSESQIASGSAGSEGSGYFQTTSGSAIWGAVATSTINAVDIEGIVRFSTSGTFIPQFKFSAAPGAAPSVASESFCELIPIGSNIVTVTGNWS